MIIVNIFLSLKLVIFYHFSGVFIYTALDEIS